jgi:hypothetical protein
MTTQLVLGNLKIEHHDSKPYRFAVSVQKSINNKTPAQVSSIHLNICLHYTIAAMEDSECTHHKEAEQHALTLPKELVPNNANIQQATSGDNRNTSKLAAVQ